MAALIEADQRARRLHEGALWELEKRETRRLADALERRDHRAPVWRSLADELALPDEQQLYAIDRILPLGGNALFAGMYKTGKTTFNGQLLKAWADGVPFLGEFDVYPDTDRPTVTIFNYEMSEAQFRRWLRRVGINNLDRVHVVHLRGLTLPLALPDVRAELAARLADVGTGLWIVDPASRAFTGAGDVNSNSDVATWLGHLDEVKLEAGIRDLVLNIHMGHAAKADKDAERALGAQAWAAWADALWFLTKDKDNCRWFSADGRDVDVDKMLVSYQAEDMSVALVDTDPETQKRNMVDRGIITVIQQNAGIGQEQVANELRGLKITTRKQDLVERLRGLAEEGVITIRKGKYNRSEHYLTEDAPPLPG